MNINQKLIGFIALLLFSGGAAAATTINPAGSDYWTLYVFGNAEVTYDILTAIKGLLSGDIFSKVLSVFGLIGVLIVATAAGFDPSKNAPKFFTLIVTVWIVVYLSLGAVATVKIIDRVGLNLNSVDESERGLRGNEGSDGIFTNIDEGSAGFLRSYIVTDVPAIVAVPISMISTLGHWMTEAVEKHFPTPPELKVSSGYYNLSAQLIQDANKLRITDKKLEKSVGNYVSDCIVPALALRKLSVTDIIQSNNIWKTLEAGSNAGLLTVDLTFKARGQGGTPTTGNNIADNMAEHKDVYGIVGGGAVVNCAVAYASLTYELAEIGYIDETDSSGRTGTEFLGMSAAAPLSNYYTSSINWLSSGGSTGAQFVQQKAMIASLTGAFRSAAVKTGNNELITATSITLAEQSQKSAWVAAADIFNNTMGYVYSALQAFMMAITPLVVLALMLPTFGVAIVKNFLQIFLWLAMWEPMLAVINFLIQSFSRASMGPVLEKEGLTMMNSATVSEMANMSSVAAGFLGTMVPLLTWGLVKGGIAFTEFISHGIGSSFANAAGAQAAGGNVSMGAVSMNMTSANKMNMASQDAFGYMSTMGNTSAGSVGQHMDAGGVSNAFNNANASPSTSRVSAVGATGSAGTVLAGSEGDGLVKSLDHAKAAETNAGYRDTAGGSTGFSTQQMEQQAVSSTIANALAHAKNEGYSESETRAYVEAQVQALSTSGGAGAGLGVNFSPGKKGGKSDGGGGGGGDGGGDGGGASALDAGQLPGSNANNAGQRIADKGDGGGSWWDAISGKLSASFGGQVTNTATESSTDTNTVAASKGDSLNDSITGSNQNGYTGTLTAGQVSQAIFGYDAFQGGSTSEKFGRGERVDESLNVSRSGNAGDTTSNSNTVSSGFSYNFGMTWHDAQAARWGGGDAINAAAEEHNAFRATTETNIKQWESQIAKGKDALETGLDKKEAEVQRKTAGAFSKAGEDAQQYIGDQSRLQGERLDLKWDSAAAARKAQEGGYTSMDQAAKERDIAKSFFPGFFSDAAENKILMVNQLPDKELNSLLSDPSFTWEKQNQLKDQAPVLWNNLMERVERSGGAIQLPQPKASNGFVDNGVGGA